MTVIEDLAVDVGASVPTIRRAVEIGLIRGTRPSPRKLDVSLTERAYVRRFWPLLSELRRHLRTEKSVRLAVLYGSTARGSAGAESDIDLAVVLDGGEVSSRMALQARLSEKVGRRVQLVEMGEARASAGLWTGILEDGRVLANRDRIDWRRGRTERT